MPRPTVLASRTALRVVTLCATALMATGVLTACTPPQALTSGTAPETDAVAAELVADVDPAAPATTAPTSGTAYDLRFVSPTAAACSVTWVPGGVLPEDYEWCADEDGMPVAGVRIGSCEVVTHGNEWYAVPGGPITASAGALHLDPQLTAMLTACKRRPALHR